MRVADLPTPCALIDLEVLERNAEWMARRAHTLGVRLRPHVKTHKCVEIARAQVQGHFGGITVSTLAEARHFAAAGFTDIVYAVPLAPRRIQELADLAQRVDRLTVLVDHPAVVAELEAFAAATGCRLSAFLKVDCGGRRAGVDPSRSESRQLAVNLWRSPLLELAGILTHAGHAYSCTSRNEVLEVARQERDVMLRFASALSRDGVVVPEISIGSTPTMCAIDDLSGITEVRPGNYIFFDAFQAAIGSCREEQIAFSVLTTVIGVYPERRHLVIDAGALALSKDPGPVHVDRECGFGLVVDTVSGTVIPELRVRALSQEHGVVAWSGGSWPTVLPGVTFRILPNHSCLAAAMFDRYFAVRDGEVVDEWQPGRGW